MDAPPTSSVLVVPAPLHTRGSTPLERPETDLYAFGYTFTPGAASESWRNCRPAVNSALERPPSYSDNPCNTVPRYTTAYEPVTLAMYLFRFGFLFPPFWLMGAFILITPLHAPPSSSSADTESITGSWLSEKNEAEKEAFVSHIRKAELKYAKCCLVAFFVFAALAGIAAGLAMGINSR